jgi:hypothetical protein
LPRAGRRMIVFSATSTVRRDEPSIFQHGSGRHVEAAERCDQVQIPFLLGE